MKLRRIIGAFIPNKVKRMIYMLWHRWSCVKKYFDHKIKKMPDIITDYSYEIIKDAGRHCFFGYYDLTPFNDRGDKILNISIKDDKDIAYINVYDKNTQKNVKITESKVWNWQQGCRLRWVPGENEMIMFNDVFENEYCCRMVDIKTGETIRTLNRPFYDISRDGKKGLSLNFYRLGIKRPGYGYTQIAPKNENLDEEGIDLIDIQNMQSERVITYKQVVVLLERQKGLSNYYINHLSFSPSGKLFLFFFLDSSTDRHESYMFVYDIEKKEIVPIEIHDKVSHYVWNTDYEIIATVYDDEMKCHYYKYDINKRSRTLYNSITNDGHPSIYTEDKILTDTYPDGNSYQHLFFTDKIGERKYIARLYSNPFIFGERRTDLHPRFDIKKMQVCVDVNRNKKRELIIFKNKRNDTSNNYNKRLQ